MYSRSRKNYIYDYNPLFPRRSLAPALFLLFEIAQAYIERRFVGRGTPTVNNIRIRMIRDATGKPDPQSTGTFHAAFAFRPQQSLRYRYISYDIYNSDDI